MAGLLYDMFNHFHTLIYFEYFVLFSCSYVCMNLCTCMSPYTHTYTHIRIYFAWLLAQLDNQLTVSTAHSLWRPQHTQLQLLSRSLSLSLSRSQWRRNVSTLIIVSHFCHTYTHTCMRTSHMHIWIHIHVYIFMSPKDYRVSYPGFSVLNNLFNAYICIAKTTTNNIHAWTCKYVHIICLFMPVC